MKRFLKCRYLILGILCLMYFIAYIDRVNISVAAPLIKNNKGQTTVSIVDRGD